MFEQELEMEKKESSVLPLLFIVAFIVVIVGVAGYYVMQSRQVLGMNDATRIAAETLKNQGPAKMKFHVGDVNGSVFDAATSPNYKLLEKASLITLGKPKGTYGQTIPVALTSKGDEMLKAVAGVEQKKESDGTTLYTVPLAERKLVNVSEIKMVNPLHALVGISWAWQTNAMGELFDAAGPMVKSFNTYDRSMLIEKYGAAFYHDPPTKVVLAMTKGDTGWGIGTE
jgi:hypothetical protein